MLLQCYPRVARTKYLCLHSGEEFRIIASFADMDVQNLCTVQHCAGVVFSDFFLLLTEHSEHQCIKCIISINASSIIIGAAAGESALAN